jgi:VanZ family protein
MAPENCSANRMDTAHLTRRTMTHTLPRWGAACVWMVLVFCLSAQPSLPRLTDRLGDIQSFAGHFLEYGVLALLLRWSLTGTSVGGKEVGAKRAALWAFVLAAAYGVTDEVHQHFVPGRHMDPLDLLTDAAGAAVALCVAALVERRRAATLAAEESRPSDSLPTFGSGTPPPER